MRACSNYPHAFIRFVQALLCLAVGSLMQPYFEPWLMTKDEFNEHGLIYKIHYMIGFCVATVLVYSFVFVMHEANFIACGFGYK